MGVFRRGLSSEFITALNDLAKQSGWWQDVLADASLIIGIRDEYFDVYWKGQSLFNANFQGGRVNVNTHVKYLLDPDRSDRVPLGEDGTFHQVAMPILERYTSGALNKLKRAADLFSGSEKEGVHAIVRANDNIIDVEVGLDARELDSDRNLPRIDIAALEQRADGVELVFWEAKLFANKELRAVRSAPVVRQIKEYEHVLQTRQGEVLSSYHRVAENLVSIAQMNGVRSVGPAIRAVAEGQQLKISSPAKVGLVVFGFDADQKATGGIGHNHLEKLKTELGEKMVRTKGSADGLKLGLLG